MAIETAWADALVTWADPDAFWVAPVDEPAPVPAPDPTARFEKLAYYRVYRADGSYVGTWSDVTARLAYSWPINGGPSTVTVRLPRAWGVVGEPGDNAARADIMEGYTVQVWVVDRQNTGGRLQYQGVIEEHAVTAGEDVEVTIVPRTAALADTFVDEPMGFRDRPPVMAWQLMVSRLPGVGWEGLVPSYGSAFAFNIENVTVGQALDQLADAAGANWYYRISVDSASPLLRFARWSEAEPPTHTLTIGRHLGDVEWRRSQMDRRNRVIVYGAVVETYPGHEERIKGVAASTDYTEEGIHRDLAYHNDRITDGATARRVAQSLLAFRRQTDLGATITVMDDNADPGRGYDIESLRPGDTVRIVNPEAAHRLPRWNEGKWGDGRKYGGTWYQQTQRTIVITNIEYQWDRAVLTLQQRPRSLVADFAAYGDKLILGGT